MAKSDNNPKPTAEMKHAQRNLNDLLETIEPYAAPRPKPAPRRGGDWAAVPRETKVKRQPCCSRFI